MNKPGCRARLRLYQDRIQASPAVEEQYKNLTRDYQTAQAFYDELLRKMNQSKMATDLEGVSRASSSGDG